ncbi:hypothetical protein C5167_017683 [Papaver somniferum]|uniref:Uncharacterized protein n=1 Tax=Papaver somniferum TaxID=3469 RepID=A0A4Y7IMC0_PAPSO|nr:hypothetical protein C5167_017683 [Papaver somniferum]
MIQNRKLLTGIRKFLHFSIDSLGLLKIFWVAIFSSH